MLNECCLLMSIIVAWIQGSQRRGIKGGLEQDQHESVTEIKFALRIDAQKGSIRIGFRVLSGRKSGYRTRKQLRCSMRDRARSDYWPYSACAWDK